MFYGVVRRVRSSCLMMSRLLEVIQRGNYRSCTEASLCVCLCIFGAFMCLCVRVRMFGNVCVNACVWGEWCKHARVHRQVGAGPGGWVASGCGCQSMFEHWRAAMIIADFFTLSCVGSHVALGAHCFVALL